MGPIVLCLTFFVGFVTVLILYLWMSEYFALRETLGFIPGPKTYPFIGLSRQIARVSHADRFKWFNDLCFTFNKGMVITWFGTEPIVNIRKPHQIEIILQDPKLVSKTRLYRTVTPWLGNGLLTSTDETWCKHKRLIIQAFGVNALEEYAVITNEKVEILMEYIESKINAMPKAPINIFELVSKCILDTICEISTGVNINVQRNSQNIHAKALQHLCQTSINRHYHSWLKWDFVFYRKKEGKKFLNARNIMNEFVNKAIEQKLAQRTERKILKQNDADSIQKTYTKQFLDFLLDACENINNLLSVDEMRQEINTFIFTSYNTISVAISWALFALANNETIQEKVYIELKQELGMYSGPIQIQHLEQLKYLDRVIAEVLRLYPSIPTIGRLLDFDMVIDYCFIPRRTLLNMQIYQLHHDPDVWENPENFDPDRFLSENVSKRHPYAYVPFSGGVRNCIGQKFALLEIKLILSIIIRQWHISSVLKPNQIKIVNNFILRPYNNKIELYFTARK